MALECDKIIDNRYKIIEKIGQGGMGAVWKAIDQQMDDEVVIKMPLLNSEPALLQRFATEARMMRKHSIGNPNILDIQGMGTVTGTPYYVMRFLPGGSLEDRCPLVDSAQATEFKIESFEWLLSISKALDYLHYNGVVHRDVKPANILFNNSGDAYLADFGIAKNPTEASSFTQYSTATGSSPGTFAYMAPEVLYPEPDIPIGGKADQYALAVTLHESIAGTRPYDSTNVIKLYRQTQEGCPPLHASFPHLPKAASQAVIQALSSNSEDRFETCSAFAIEFLGALRTASDSGGLLDDQQDTKSLPQLDRPDTWAVSKSDFAQYVRIFRELDSNGDGRVFGKEAKVILDMSNLPDNELATIWNLCASRNTGFLNEFQFVLAIYISKARMLGAALPSMPPKRLLASVEAEGFEFRVNDSSR